MHEQHRANDYQSTQITSARGLSRYFTALMEQSSRARVLRRILFALSFFFIADMLLTQMILGTSDLRFESHYRFRQGTDISSLGLYAEHIKKTANKNRGRETIVFLGSSPTYGHHVSRDENTYPYALEAEINRLSRAEGSAQAKKVYNLASNGQLLADQYYIAKSLIDVTDAFIVQLNYHTFNPNDTKRPIIRYPDIPEQLGVSLAVDEARVLKQKSIPEETVNAAIKDFIGRYSFIVSHRDLVTNTLFGEPPEQAIFKRAKLSGADIALSDELLGPSTAGPGMPFDSLSPKQQMFIIERCSDLYDFTINNDDSELYFLNKLLALFAQHEKPAFFFMTPLNTAVLNEYGIMDWKAYGTNTRALQATIEGKGFVFKDATASEILSAEQFFDISHSLDSGGIICGTWLALESRGYLWARR